MMGEDRSHAGSGQDVRQPFCIRLNRCERLRLESEAGETPIGTYVRARLLGESGLPPRRRLRRPSADREALGKLLAALGDSRIANNLNQLARAANSGAMPVCDDTSRLIAEACGHVQWMRKTLIAALALTPKEDETP